MSQWVPALVTGILATATAVFLAIWNRRAQKAAAVQNANIESTLAQDAALRSYEFEARKRLYTEVNPLVFQLRELSRGSRNRARRIVSGEMVVGPDHVLTSVQRLFAPLVIVQEIQRHLTVVDLRLDVTLSAQYAVAKELLWTFHSGVAIAGTAPRIPYRSSMNPSEPRQHLTHAHLLRLVDFLTVPEANGTRRPMKQTELDDIDRAKEAKLDEALRPFSRLLAGASAGATPVLWRLLLAHSMFLHIFSDLVDRNDSVVAHLMPPDIDLYSWHPSDPGSFIVERDAAGKGPGASLWLGAARNLARQASDAREQVREHEMRLGQAASAPLGGQPQSAPAKGRLSGDRTAAILFGAATAVMLLRNASSRRK